MKFYNYLREQDDIATRTGKAIGNVAKSVAKDVISDLTNLVTTFFAGDLGKNLSKSLEVELASLIDPRAKESEETKSLSAAVRKMWEEKYGDLFEERKQKLIEENPDDEVLDEVLFLEGLELIFTNGRYFASFPACKALFVDFLQKKKGLALKGREVDSFGLASMLKSKEIQSKIARDGLVKIADEFLNYVYGLLDNNQFTDSIKSIKGMDNFVNNVKNIKAKYEKEISARENKNKETEVES